MTRLPLKLDEPNQSSSVAGEYSTALTDLLRQDSRCRMPDNNMNRTEDLLPGIKYSALHSRSTDRPGALAGMGFSTKAVVVVIIFSVLALLLLVPYVLDAVVNSQNVPEPVESGPGYMRLLPPGGPLLRPPAEESAPQRPGGNVLGPFNRGPAAPPGGEEEPR